MLQPDGKSGALMILFKAFQSISGLSITAFTPCIISVMLCGGIFVAIPTAIPVVPFASNIGMREGRTFGSFSDPSKLSTKSTVLDSISAKTFAVIFCNLDSVYLIAAGPSSKLPKLP